MGRHLQNKKNRKPRASLRRSRSITAREVVNGTQQVVFWLECGHRKYAEVVANANVKRAKQTLFETGQETGFRCDTCGQWKKPRRV